MSKRASEFQFKIMSLGYCGKGIFKPLNTGWIDEHIGCIREYIANIFFYKKGDVVITGHTGWSQDLDVIRSEVNPLAAIGTNSWGSKAYGMAVRGSYVDMDTIGKAVSCAREEGLLMFDVARDYGFGQAEKIFGQIGTEGLQVSAKYTPFSHYKKGCVWKSLQKDLEDLGRDQIDVYWLHAPTDIDEHLAEIIEIYRAGKIGHIGVSNFNLEECKRAKAILNEAGIPLFGVQNHYSIICRSWEDEGVTGWCRENGIQFWAWAVLEEGMLTDPRVKGKSSVMKLLFNRQKKKLMPLYKVMNAVGKRHDLTIPQVAMSFVSTKGLIPICGCRKPYQVKDLADAVKVTLTPGEMKKLEETADQCNAKVLGADLFRIFVLKKKSRCGTGYGR